MVLATCSHLSVCLAFFGCTFGNIFVKYLFFIIFLRAKAPIFLCFVFTFSTFSAKIEFGKLRLFLNSLQFKYW